MEILYNINVISQDKSMSCWAAAAAALIGWKENNNISEADIAKRAGPQFEICYNNNTGLLGHQIHDFARSLGMPVEAPQNYLPSGYFRILSNNGPLWIGTAIFSQSQIYRHVRIVYGIIGDGQSEATLVYVMDPDGGRLYQETVEQLSRELEQIARDDLGPDGPGHLSPQIIRLS